MLYFYVKAVHIIFVVSWFAGLFYIVRLFIYHVEAGEQPAPAKGILQTEYKRIEVLLWKIIMRPAATLTVVTGLTMSYLDTNLWHRQWFLVKLGLVGGLLIYHWYCGRIRKSLEHDISPFTSFQLRMWNELATIFLVSIVFIVVLKNAFSWIYGTLGLIVFGILIMLAVRLVRRIREGKN